MRTRYTPRHLALFDRIQEAPALVDALTTRRSEAPWKAAQVGKHVGHVVRLKQIRHDHDASIDHRVEQRRQAKDEIAALRRPYAAVHSDCRVSLAQTLRTLLTLAHPDTWRQGPPATALAYEIATTLNALRQRLEKEHSYGDLG